MNYEQLNELFRDIPRPFAFIDLNSLHQNIKDIADRAQQVKLRIASKSIRCRYILEHILQQNSQYQGLMTYHPSEALWLAENGFDNLLMGYPYTHERMLKPLLQKISEGKNIVFMVDLPIHVQILNRLAKEIGVIAPICVDVDMSTDFGLLWFGVKRSSIRNLQQFQRFIQTINELSHVKIVGIMGYEAQIAGLGDKQKSLLKRLVIPILKKKSIKELSKRRTEMIEWTLSQGVLLSIINGGGTGSIESTIQEKYVNEVTVGSGLYSSGLFDLYNGFCHKPAAFFGIEITRNPEKNVYTCAGGGYIASGSVGLEKQPTVFLPQGLQFLPDEGFGEVQTPFLSKQKLQIGDCVFLRHAKAGELCERFSHFYVVENEKIINIVPTYRGEEKCFV